MRGSSLAFYSKRQKARLDPLSLLTPSVFCRTELKFKFNESSYALMSEFGLSALRLVELKKTVNSEILTNEQLNSLLDERAHTI